MVSASFGPNIKQAPANRFGRSNLPWDVWVAENQVINREIIDLVGYEPLAIGLARNNNERIERAMDGGSWLLIGVCGPLLLDTFVNRGWTKKLTDNFKDCFTSLQTLKTRFPKAKEIRFQPIGLPLELLDRAGFEGRIKPNSKAMEHLKDAGLKKLPAKLANQILKYKLLIIWFDLLIMASKGQLYSWGKNWVTEKLSKKKGFVGEFKYASDDYLKLKADKYEKEKKKNFWTSFLIGYGSACTLPLILWGLMTKSKTPIGAKNTIGQIKRLIPALNYFDVIYMSKWLMLWDTVFNWNLSGYLSSRDESEKREAITRGVANDVFFFIGDDLFSAGLGKLLEAKYKKQLQGIKLVKQGFWKIPRAVSLGEFHKMTERLNGQYKPETLKLARKLIWGNFLGSIATTAACLGVSMTMLNNWYTEKKVLKEQKELEAKGVLKKANASHQTFPSTYAKYPFKSNLVAQQRTSS